MCDTLMAFDYKLPKTKSQQRKKINQHLGNQVEENGGIKSVKDHLKFL